MTTAVLLYLAVGILITAWFEWDFHIRGGHEFQPLPSLIFCILLTLGWPIMIMFALYHSAKRLSK